MHSEGQWWVAPHGPSAILTTLLRSKRDQSLARLVALTRLCLEAAPQECAESGVNKALAALKDMPQLAVEKSLTETPSFGCWLNMVESALSSHIGQRNYDGFFASSLPADPPALVALLNELWRYVAGAAIIAERSPPSFHTWFSGEVSLPGTSSWMPSVNAGEEITSVSITSDRKPAITAGDQTCRLDLDRTDVFSRLWAKDEQFPGERRGRLAEEEALAAYAARLTGAISMLRQTRPLLTEEIGLTMRSVIPLLSVDPDINLSVSAPEFFGATMVTYDSTPMLAEALAHEYRHNLLNAITDVSALVEPEGERQIVYSPWRDDPRPVMGLFHALFTFTEVVEFLRNAVLSRTFSTVNARAAARRCTAHATRLEIGIQEIEGVRDLSQFGVQMIEGFKNALLDIRADLPTLMSIGGQDPVEAVYEHERLFRNKKRN